MMFLGWLFEWLNRTPPASVRCDGCGEPIAPAEGGPAPHRTPYGRWICGPCREAAERGNGGERG